jgi:hypothetical protein
VAVDFYKNFAMFLGNWSLLAAGKVNFGLVGSGFDGLRKGGILPGWF